MGVDDVPSVACIRCGSQPVAWLQLHTNVRRELMPLCAWCVIPLQQFLGEHIGRDRDVVVPAIYEGTWDERGTDGDAVASLDQDVA